ncbi:cytochrome c oxidase assembly protein subunit 15 [Friedmanniella endophytica]|uniref:Cytochrome c oxidase assembly protein subunit 15 n=1 Tax=Microlunatus kandeliicorticis TaxID=1759536 RepID=A0A7W3IS65_9ACTN|nr:COX15/CtaA family protein [Microlunatus kandeliicorticis]MBA8794252.1 cytochrome c oxidase assembly protein subunit 15 [Microlunatus kandeliicorticis]
MAVLTPDRTTETPVRRTGGALRGLAVATLVANIGIIVTGGLVRLTSSGLGCPTWPRCTPESFVTHPALGIHGAIEFGNRLLTFVLLIIAVLTLLAAVFHREDGRRRRDLIVLTAGLLFGIPFQGVIGGISVLTKLNPFVVALHLILSMVLVALSVWLVRLTWRARVTPVGTGRWTLTRLTWVALWVTVWLGTIVTGTGPHAGDANAPRTGFDGLLVTHVHAASVYVSVALTIVALIALRSRAAVLLLVIELAQGGIGFWQYFTGLPIQIVIFHLLGAAGTVALATNLALSVRRTRVPATP